LTSDYVSVVVGEALMHLFTAAWLGVYFRRVIMTDPLSQSSDLYHQAREVMEKNQLEDAVRLFQQSITLSPHFKSLELLGECFIHLNRLAEAVVPLAAATTLNQGVRAPSLLADVFLKLEDYDRANELAKIALSRDPDNRMALNAKKVAADILGDD
jgi:tetratricopeptide (TPR) repeat protein